MVSIPLGLGDWESPSENVPRLRLRNMYIAENPNSPDGLSRYTRPALDEFDTVGTGPIYGFWRQDGTLEDKWLVVSAEELYLYDYGTGVATLIDPLPGEGFCQFAGTADRVIIVRDGTAYSTDGVNVSVVVMPDDVPPHEGFAAPVQSVACINSTFLLSVQDTHRFYWIFPGEVDPNPLNFASAERTPDPIVSINILSDEIWFIGTEGPEVWQTTADPEDPFTRINGRVYNEGCASRDTVVTAVANNNPCLIWVTDEGSVVLTQGSPQKISNNSVEEALKSATNLKAWPFRHNRHDFYLLTANEFTYAFDLSRGEWGRWDSYGLDYFRASLGFMYGSQPIGADSETNKLYRLTNGYSDGDDPIVREISGVIHNPGKNLPCSCVILRVNSGWSPTLGFTPMVEIRWSDDQGTTWSDYYPVSLGDKGVYWEDVILRSLGKITRPARNFEIRFSELASFRLDAAYMNEAE
jgi:hypothetical protein